MLERDNGYGKKHTMIYNLCARNTLATSPAKVAKSAPGSVYLVLVTFATMK